MVQKSFSEAQLFKFEPTTNSLTQMLELHTSCDTDGEEKPNAGYTELWFGRLNIPTMNYGLGLCNIANFGVNIWRNLPVLPATRIS